MKIFALAMLLVTSVPAQAQDAVSVSKRQASDRTHILVHEVVVDAPVHSVWETVSTGKGWKTWAAPVAWSLRRSPDIIETSFSPGARPNDPSTIKQKIIARVPEVMMVYRTVKAPADFPDFATYSKVTNVLQLEPVGDGKTRVRHTAAGYADTPAGQRLLKFFEQGNTTALRWLSKRFSVGPIDWSKELASQQ